MKYPEQLKQTIANNIRQLRQKRFPGRGGGKKCAEAFGVSPQQWSPWETGKRTPDEFRMEQIAKFFCVSVEYLRRDNEPSKSQSPEPEPEKLSTENSEFYSIIQKLVESGLKVNISVQKV